MRVDGRAAHRAGGTVFQLLSEKAGPVHFQKAFRLGQGGILVVVLLPDRDILFFRIFPGYALFFRLTGPSAQIQQALCLFLERLEMDVCFLFLKRDIC